MKIVCSLFPIGKALDILVVVFLCAVSTRSKVSSFLCPSVIPFIDFILELFLFHIETPIFWLQPPPYSDIICRSKLTFSNVSISLIDSTILIRCLFLFATSMPIAPCAGAEGKIDSGSITH